MDLPNQDHEALRKDLEHIAGLNRTFGARRAVAALFHRLTSHLRRIVLVDLASGYGDHGRNLIERARKRQQEVTVLALDCQLKTLQIARKATPPGQKMFFVQADARALPLRNHQADVVFCSLALHHFSDDDALGVLREMRRVARIGVACIDLARSRLASWAIWLLTTFIIRDPMVRHDARLSIRRAFSTEEMKKLAHQAGWLWRHLPVPLFQQAVMGENEELEA
jgi:ubiquinone/menaquinone biosynthesis C-methylase UbiE